MQVTFSSINFTGMPKNYGIIDESLSRSAQPNKEDFVWLKEQGVTDIFNFRTMGLQLTDFNEEEEVAKVGIKYHHIPSVTAEPTEENVDKFLREVEEIKAKGEKLHIHCMAGADRTGMYTFIYKIMNGIGSLAANKEEWYDFGLHYQKYPKLIEWAEKFLQKRGKLI